MFVPSFHCTIENAGKLDMTPEEFARVQQRSRRAADALRQSDFSAANQPPTE